MQRKVIEVNRCLIVLGPGEQLSNQPLQEREPEGHVMNFIVLIGQTDGKRHRTHSELRLPGLSV